MMIICLLPVYANRVGLNNDPLGQVILLAMCLIPWHTLNLFIGHWIVTKVGFLFVGAEVLR